MQYLFVRENGGRKAAGETKMYLERLMRDICRRGRLELSDFRLYTAKADDYNAWAIGGNHITVTERLLNEFSEEEVKGILAHEVGHLQNGHSRFGLLRYGMEWFSGIIVYVYRFQSDARMILPKAQRGNSLPALYFTPPFPYPAKEPRSLSRKRGGKG